MPTKVLAFHHVLRAPTKAVGPEVDVAVSPHRLAACLEAHWGWDLVDYRRILSRRPGRRSLLLTFDDGYLGVLTEALPVLEAFEAPCVVFVVSGYLDRTVRPMETDVAWIAEQTRGVEPRRLYERVGRRLRRLRPQQQRRAVKHLARRHDVPYPPPLNDVLLDWEQVVRLADHPLVTIGSHTVSHAWLGLRRWRLAAAEAGRSKHRIEQMLDRPVECFAYPYGQHSAAVRRAVARAGYRLAFTTEPRLVPESGAVEPMAVPRFAADGPAGWGPLEHEADRTTPVERPAVAYPGSCMKQAGQRAIRTRERTALVDREPAVSSDTGSDSGDPPARFMHDPGYGGAASC